MTAEIQSILKAKGYEIEAIEPYGAGYYVFMKSRKGLTQKTIERRLTGTGLDCTRFGWKIHREFSGHYMFVIERTT